MDAPRHDHANPDEILDTIRTARKAYESHLVSLLDDLAAEAAARFPGEIETVSLYGGEVLIRSLPGTREGVHWDTLMSAALKVEHAGRKYLAATGVGFMSGLSLRASAVPQAAPGAGRQAT